MGKGSRVKTPRLVAAGFRSFDLADAADSPAPSKSKSEAQRQFEKVKERKRLGAREDSSSCRLH
jgi:hypothetical protein